MLTEKVMVSVPDGMTAVRPCSTTLSEAELRSMLILSFRLGLFIAGP